MTTYQIIALVLGSNLLASILTLLANRGLRNADTRKREADVTDVVAKTYSGIVKSLNDELTRLKEINKEMAASKDKLIEQLDELEREVISLRREVHKLTERLKKYE